MTELLSLPENTPIIDPKYVQITKKQAAEILGRSTAELDKLRVRDPRCPKGFKATKLKTSRVMFRLSDMYIYSSQLISDAETVTNEALTEKET